MVARVDVVVVARPVRVVAVGTVLFVGVIVIVIVIVVVVVIVGVAVGVGHHSVSACGSATCSNMSDSIPEMCWSAAT